MSYKNLPTLAQMGRPPLAHVPRAQENVDVFPPGDSHSHKDDLGWIRQGERRLVIMVDNQLLADVLNGKAAIGSSTHHKTESALRFTIDILVALQPCWVTPANWVTWRSREHNGEADMAANAILDGQSFTQVGLRTYEQPGAANGYILASCGALWEGGGRRQRQVGVLGASRANAVPGFV